MEDASHVRIRCSCGKNLKAPRKHAGKRARCGSCGESHVIPGRRKRPVRMVKRRSYAGLIIAIVTVAVLGVGVYLGTKFYGPPERPAEVVRETPPELVEPEPPPPEPPPPPPPEPEEPRETFDDYAARAKEAMDREDPSSALQIWERARKALSSPRERVAIDEEMDRVTRAQSDWRLLESVKEEDELGALGGVLVETRAQRESRTWKEVEARALEIRAQMRGQKRAAAEKRLEAILAAQQERETDQTGAMEARTEAARAASKRSPVDYAGGAQVTAFGEREFSLVAQGGRVEATFKRGQNPALTAQVLRRACRKDAAGDYVEMATFCLRHRLFDEARWAATALEEISSEESRGLPDIDVLEKASRPLLGAPPKRRLKRSERGYRDGAIYDFAVQGAEALLGDWTPLDETTLVGISSRGMTVQGKGNAPVLMKEAGFDGAIAVEVKWPHGSSDAIVQVLLDAEGTKGTFMAAYLSDEGHVMLRRGGEAKPWDSNWVEAGSRPTVTIKIAGGKATLLIAGEKKASMEAPRFQRARVMLLRATGDKSSVGTITWPRIAVTGQFRREWLRKSIAAYGHVYFREIQRCAEAQAKDEDRPERPLFPSSDDAYGLAGMSGGDLDRYRVAWTFLRQGKHGEALPILDRIIAGTVQPAGAYYGRALCRLAREDRSGALGDLENALALDPEFPEALIRRAEIRSLQGHEEGIEADLGKARRLAPDSSLLYRLRGFLSLREESYETARADLCLCVALDPADGAARAALMSVCQVIDGPPWEKRYDHVTDHFRVGTNISAKRAEEVGRLLEEGRVASAALLGNPIAGGDGRKATCLVFDTDVGFYNYASLLTFGATTEGWTRGLYATHYRQLLFFEDKNDAEGKEFRQVLFHEGFHRYSDEVMPGCPTWLDEGLAELVSGELCHEDGILEGRLANLEHALEEGKAPTVARLVSMGTREWRGEGEAIHYAMSWALCRYLLRGTAGTDPARLALRAYVGKLMENEDPQAAFAEAFDGVDLRGVDRGFREWVASLRRS